MSFALPQPQLVFPLRHEGKVHPACMPSCAGNLAASMQGSGSLVSQQTARRCLRTALQQTPPARDSTQIRSTVSLDAAHLTHHNPILIAINRQLIASALTAAARRGAGVFPRAPRRPGVVPGVCWSGFSSLIADLIAPTAPKYPIWIYRSTQPVRHPPQRHHSHGDRYLPASLLQVLRHAGSGLAWRCLPFTNSHS